MTDQSNSPEFSKPTKNRPFKELMHNLREREITEALLSVFAEQGCFSFRVEDAAARAGVAKGSIYNHFRSKGETLRAALGRLYMHVLAEYERRVQGPLEESTARDRLAVIAEILLELELKRKGYQSPLVERLPCSLENHGQVYKARPIHDLVASVIESGLSSRRPKGGLPASTLAQLFVAIVTSHPFREMANSAGAQQASEAAVDFFLLGAAA